MQSGRSCPRGGGASGRCPQHLGVSQNLPWRLLPPLPPPAQAIALLVPGTSNAGLGQHSPLPHRSALRLPLGAGCRGRLRVGGAGGSGLAVASYGPPFSPAPARTKPSPEGERKVALGMKKKKFLSFFSISWLFGPHPCSRQQMSPSSVLSEGLNFLQLPPKPALRAVSGLLSRKSSPSGNLGLLHVSPG